MKAFPPKAHPRFYCDNLSFAENYTIIYRAMSKRWGIWRNSNGEFGSTPMVNLAFPNFSASQAHRDCQGSRSQGRGNDIFTASYSPESHFPSYQNAEHNTIESETTPAATLRNKRRAQRQLPLPTIPTNPARIPHGRCAPTGTGRTPASGESHKRQKLALPAD